MTELEMLVDGIGILLIGFAFLTIMYGSCEILSKYIQ